MRIHAIQTGTVAVKERQVQGKGRGGIAVLNTLLDRHWTQSLPIYAWVIEHPEGIIVVDTGETAQASTPGYFPRWHPYYRLGVKAWVTPDQEIGPRMQALGIPASEVRWVVMTHLHTDHAGGLHHFPQAEILVSRKEYEAACGFMGKLRGYLPHRWPAWFAPRLIDFADGPVGPFPTSDSLTQAGDVHLVPTPGHSAGHLSVIVEDGGLSFFLAGDTSYTQELMHHQAIDGVTRDWRAARATLARTLQYVEDVPTVYLPSHDPESARRLLQRQIAAFARTPA